jgi:hypothetical protein
MAKNMIPGFAFVPANKVPKQERVDGATRLAAFREKQAAERAAAGAAIAEGLLAGKALTDNLAFEDRAEAVKTGNRAKALALHGLPEGKRPALAVTGTDDGQGYRWWVTAVDAPVEVAAE